MDTPGLLSAVLQAANRRDLDAILALTDPEFEGTVPSSMSAEPDVYLGHEGVRRYFESFWEIVDGLNFQIEEFDQAGDWTIAQGYASGTGRASGLPIENRIALACLARGELLHRLDVYPDMDEARAGVESG